MIHLLMPLILIISSFLPQKQNILGKYKMEYEEKYNSENCIINFKDNTYKKKTISGTTTKGTIEYQQYFIILKDKKSPLQVEFFKKDIAKDTIYFRTKDVNEKVAPKGRIVIYSGKLIRME